MNQDVANPESPSSAPTTGHGIGRRRFLTAAGAVVATGLGARLAWEKDESQLRARVFIAKAANYEIELRQTIRDGLAHLGLPADWARGKTVLLKPNLVEPTRSEPQINTHPLLVRAVAETFRAQGAKEVLVAEGQGHCRDTDFVLEQSRLGPILHEMKAEFVDLNHDDVFSRPNRVGYTKLRQLYLPATLKRADIIVSLPKMKTHHWAGITLSMKNLFGVMPGVAYGWPKNVLHHMNIPWSIVDITGTVAPHLAIVDGIVGMEGDGPIMGTPKSMGVVVMGTNLPAVDATCARLMDILPERIEYLSLASGLLGPITEGHITQAGEPIAPLKQRFALLADHPPMQNLRDG